MTIKHQKHILIGKHYIKVTQDIIGGNKIVTKVNVNGENIDVTTCNGSEYLNLDKIEERQLTSYVLDKLLKNNYKLACEIGKLKERIEELEDDDSEDECVSNGTQQPQVYIIPNSGWVGF